MDTPSNEGAEHQPSTSSRERWALHAVLAGSGISLVGNEVGLIAIPWFLLEITGSASFTGLAMSANFIAVLIAGFFGGVLVDRLGYRDASVAADILSGAAVAAIPLLHLTVGLELWHVVTLVFVGALLDTPGATARRALVPDLASRAGWTADRGIGSLSVLDQGAYLAGPFLAGALIPILGATNVLWVDAFTFVVSAGLMLIAVHRTARPIPDAGRRYLAELKEGVTWLRSDRVLVRLTAALVVTNFVNAASIVLLPVFAKRFLGGALHLGLMMGLAGAASLIGVLLFTAKARALPRRRTFLAARLGTSVWYFAFALFPPLGVVLLARIVSGFADGPINPIINAVQYERVPEGLRGRVFGAVDAAAWIAIPLGIVVTGYSIEFIGMRPTLLALGCIHLSVTAVLAASNEIRRIERKPA